MSTPNPIDRLVSLTGQVSDTAKTTVNPVDDLIGQLPIHTIIPRPPSLGEMFAQGLGAGLLHPIQSITGTEAGDTTGLTNAQAGSKVAGEILGMGVSFIPFLKGAQLALKGVGLAARMSPALLRLAEGALAAGTYEVASGPLEQAPERVAKGAAFGLAMEAGFMGAAAVWRGRFPSTMNTPDLPTANVDGVAVHPDALKVEQYLRPIESQNTDEIVLKLRQLGDVSQQMEFVAAEVAKTFKPGGLAIIPGIQKPQELVNYLGRTMPEMKFSFRPTEGGLYEVLMADAQAQSRMRLVQGAKGGREPVLSFDQAVRLVETDAPLEPGVPVFRGTKDEVNRRYAAGKGNVPTHVLGYARYNPTRSIGLVDNPAYRFEVLIHEYTHILTARTSTRRLTGLTEEPASMLGLSSISELWKFGPKHPRAAPTQLEGPAISKWAKARFEDNIATVRAELENATVETVRRFQEAIDGTPVTIKRAQQIIKDRPGYYHSDTELVSRLTELMFLDPMKARELAPRATRMMSNFIRKESPKLRILLKKKELKNINDIITDLWIKQGDDVFYFKREPFQLTDKMRRQFAQRGVFEGMEVMRNGKPYEVGVLSSTGDQVKLRKPKTGELLDEFIPVSEVHRPLFPAVVQRDAEVLGKVKSLFDAPPAWVGVVLGDNIAQGVRRAVVELGDFEFATSFGRWVRENRQLITKDSNPEVMAKFTGGRESIEDLVAEALKAKGKNGLAINDNGRYLLFVADGKAVRLSDEILSPQLVDGPIDGQLPFGSDKAVTGKSRWIEVSHRNLSESLLRSVGVGDRELPHYLRLDPLADVASRIMDVDVREALRNSARVTEVANIREPAENVAASYGFRIDRTEGGEFRVLSREHVEVARLPNEDAARQYMAQSGPQDMSALDVGGHTPTDFVASSGTTSPPPRFQAQAAPRRFSERLLDSTTLFASTFSALENWAKAAERTGLGPAFTKIFEPAQKAIQRVDWELAKIKRDLLGGKTFNEQLRHIEGLARGMKPEQQANVVRYIEYMSKEEIAAPGGLLQRGMTDNEIRIAQEFERLGMQDDIPRLMATDRLIGAILKSRDQFLIKSAQMQRMEVTPEIKATIDKLRAYADETPTHEAVMDYLGLSQEERFALKIIESSKGTNGDMFSIFAVSRYASAKPLKRGFRTGREQFASDHGMTSREVVLAQEMDKTYEAAFRMSGLDPKRQIGGYWPHLRKFAEYGFTPEADFIRRHLPDAVEWSALRFRTGELDIYSMDPVMTTFKHVRNMLMKKEFDPILPDIKEALGVTKQIDPRTHRIMSEYIQEIMGKPHASFDKVQQAINQSWKNMTGRELPDNFVKGMVNTLTALGYGATIPFRPALIIRNYFSILQMVTPRTGFRAFLDGAQVALTKEGMEEAAKAGAITANVAPVFGTSEVFEFGATKLNRRLQRLLEKGFSWYQKADDLGRSVAFHAQKSNIKAHMDDLFQGRIDYETFKNKSKINTFDPIDIQEFDRMWGAGQYEEAANMMGIRLARESIFRYGHANHPAGWGSIYGRLFGQFGTWPVQYKDYVLQGMTRGTTKDRLEFGAIHASINMGVVGAGLAVGMDLRSWVSFPSLNYTGGPFADLAISGIQAIGGSPQERELAIRNIMFQVPTLDDPSSIFVPGSYLLADLMRMGDADNLAEAGFVGSGFKFLKPKDDPDWSFLLGF